MTKGGLPRKSPGRVFNTRNLPWITLHVGLTRFDGSKDNTPLAVVDTLAEHGFKLRDSHVFTFNDAPTHVSCQARVPDHEPHKWITKLVRVAVLIGVIGVVILDFLWFRHSGCCANEHA